MKSFLKKNLKLALAVISGRKTSLSYNELLSLGFSNVADIESFDAVKEACEEIVYTLLSELLEN